MTYLGRIINTQVITPQVFSLRKDHLKTLNDFQKLLGDINWIRPYLKITTAQLKPLFNILQGNSDPVSSREITPEAQKALQTVEKAMNDCFLQRIDIRKTWDFLILSTPISPTGVLQQDGPLEWIHLPVTPKKIVTAYPALIATLILKGRKRSRELFGKEMDNIVIPYNKDQLNDLLQFNEDWQTALENYTGQIKFHLPGHPLVQFFAKHPVIFPTLSAKNH